MSKRSILAVVAALAIPLIIITACSFSPTDVPRTPVLASNTSTAVNSPEPSLTPIPPTSTSTPVPLALVINGEEITLSDFEAEVGRYQAAAAITGTQVATDTVKVVMNELIDQTLLAQGAAEIGFVVDEATLQRRIGALVSQLGGQQALEDWKIEHGYSDPDFEQALRRAVGAAWMRDQIVNEVPENADQVHVAQILLFDEADADEVYQLLQSGSDFMELAATYDPVSHGELGWFPRGFLGEPAIDEAVFALQPDQYTAVIETEIGYHILYVIERDANHPLQPDAKIALQVEALKEWLRERREQSVIQDHIP